MANPVAKDVDEAHGNFADLQEAIRERLQKAKEERAEGDITDRLMLKLLENHTFDVPERLVDHLAQPENRDCFS